MKLLYSTTSPFTRKVLVVACERGLEDRIERVPVTVSPVTSAAEVAPHNPSGKIPTLLLPDGTALYDSRVIVEYLDLLPGGPRVIPAEGTARFTALTYQALADALTDASVLVRYETVLRPEPLRWPEWLAGQWAKIDRSLDELERRPPALGAGTPDIGAIAVGCALGYLDFRYAERDWRARRPALARWWATFAERPSMRATVPVQT